MVKGLPLADCGSYLDERATFMGQWGLKASRKPGGPSYEELVENEGRPGCGCGWSGAQTGGLLQAAVVYGYFRLSGVSTNPQAGGFLLEAVLFDMDGLLVDTEPLWLETESEVMTRLGGRWTEADQQALLGGSMARTVAYILARARPAAPGRPAGTQLVPPEQVAAWMMEGMLARVAAGRVGTRPGARELLAEVAASGVPYALVTSSEREFADAVLASTGFRFPVVVTGDDVTAHKPDPEPYLLAATLLGVDPTRCVALEDSPNGVASAGAAGCLVIAVPSLLPLQPAPGRLVMSSLGEVNMEVLLCVLAKRAGMSL